VILNFEQATLAVELQPCELSLPQLGHFQSVWHLSSHYPFGSSFLSIKVSTFSIIKANLISSSYQQFIRKDKKK
jgi:hypothetical protein